MKNITSISVVVLAATLGFAQSAPTRPVAAPATAKSSAAPAKAAKKKSRKQAKPTPVQVETVPAPPPPPPTLAQQPPVAPNVVYKNGLLSIDAPNSTLGDILGGIRRATGVSIEGPTAIGDRMVVHLGPGEPRQIVASLLGGSRFDYIVMGSPQQPNGINKLVLLARQGGAPPVTGAVSPTMPQQQQRVVVANTDEDEDDVPERDENADVPPSQPVVAQPEPQYTGQPMPPEQNANQPDQQNQDPNNPNAPKTPEQLYKELQSLERQRQTPTPTQRPQTEQPPQPPPPQ